MKMIAHQISIEIKADSKVVFEYISNLENDKFWRDEIHSTIVSPNPSLGAIAIEDSYLSKKVPSYLRKLRCVSYIQGDMVCYQTEPGDSHFLKSIRQCLPISHASTKFTYQLEFHPSIVKYGMGFSLPGFIVNMATKSAMLRYVRTLKTILEKINIAQYSPSTQKEHNAV